MRHIIFILLLITSVNISAQSYQQDIDLYLDVYLKPQGSTPIAGGVFNDNFIFSVDRFRDKQLWITDGTEENTYILNDTKTNYYSASFELVKSNQNMIFFVNYLSQYNTAELYASDGAKNKLPRKLFSLSSFNTKIDKLYPTKNGIYFTVSKAGCVAEYDYCHTLMYSDGISEAVEVVVDNLTPTSYSVKNIVESDGNTILFISSKDNDKIYKESTPGQLTSIFTANKQATYFIASSEKCTYFSVKDNGQDGLYSLKNNKVNKLIAGDYYKIRKEYAKLYKDNLYFLNATNNKLIYLTDGDSTGLYLNSGSLTTSPSEIFVSNDKLFISSFGIHVYDGINPLKKISDLLSPRTISSINGVTIITDSNNIYKYREDQGILQLIIGNVVFKVFENSVYVIYNKELRFIDANAGTSILVSKLNNYGFERGFPYEVGNRLYFYNFDILHDEELWVTQGTVESTKMVKDINIGTQGQLINELNSIGSKLFIDINHLNNSEDSLEGLFIFDKDTKALYQNYDGDCIMARAGKYMVVIEEPQIKDTLTIFSTKGEKNDLIPIGKVPATTWINTVPHTELYEFGDKVLINYDGGLMVSDGTPQGTFNILNKSIHNEYKIYKNIFYFIANEYVNANNSKNQLWRTDGTISGTYKILDGDIKRLTIFQDRLIFLLNDRVHILDGQSIQTKIQWIDGLKDFIANDSLFIAVTSNNTLNTFPFNVNNIIQVNTGSYLKPFYTLTYAIRKGLELNGTILIEDNFSNLYSTNGTTVGTKLVTTGFESYKILEEYEGGIYFTKPSSEFGNELWVTNGTSEGTYLIKDLYKGSTSSNPSSMHLFGDEMLFLAGSPRYGWHFLKEIFLLKNFFTPDLQGTVFEDKNNNGIKDVGESGVAGITVKLLPNGETTTSDASGSYYFELEDDIAYSITLEKNNCWSKCTETELPVKDIIDQNLRQVKAIDIPVCKDNNEEISLQTNLISSTERCNAIGNQIITIKNNSCNAISGKVVIKFDKRDSITYSPSQYDTITSSYTFTFDNLLSNEVKNFVVSIIRPNEEFARDTLSYFLKTYYKQNNEYIIFDSTNIYQAIRCAFDPNDKLVYPARKEASNSNFTQFDEFLTYTIRFQNTGNDTAFNVMIRDTLSSLLDIESFRPFASSHKYNYTLDRSGAAAFYFPDINLVDSFKNEPLSNGFISFSIKSKSNINMFDKIINTAYIYFDLNKPIITNSTLNTLVEHLDKDGDNFNFYEDCNDDNADINPIAQEIPDNNVDENCDGSDIINSVNDEDDLHINIYPNPTNDNITIHSKETISNYNLYDAFGNKLKYDLLKNNNISFADLKCGIYFLQLNLSHSNKNKFYRIVKI